MYEFLIDVDADTNIEKYTYLTNDLLQPLTTSKALDAINDRESLTKPLTLSNSTPG